MTKEDLDKEMMGWWEEIKPNRANIPPAPVRVEVSTTILTRTEPIPQKPADTVLLGGTNSNTNATNGNI